jgi:hypothetical protein
MTEPDTPDPKDANRRRFEEILEAKKAGRKAGASPDAPDRGKGGRTGGPKGSRGYTRRKV